MNRIIRYQGAIVQDEQILLIRHRHHSTGESYWLFPGGGIEDGETEEECVQREMREETNLHVAVERLLLDEPTQPGAVYKRRRTFLCSVVSGTAAPGYEPEEDAAAAYGIVEVAWFDLRDENSWPPLAKGNSITYPQLLGVQQTLGYRNSVTDE
ncbi:MAG: NUDIX hydrolase [Chloroflexi bacterium]|nr:NUDIX hydrolase [Chloroflexota bacterium]